MKSLEITGLVDDGALFINDTWTITAVKIERIVFDDTSVWNIYVSLADSQFPLHMEFTNNEAARKAYLQLTGQWENVN